MWPGRKVLTHGAVDYYSLGMADWLAAGVLPACMVLPLRVLQVGIVTDIWLWYGAFVDVLADFKG